MTSFYHKLNMLMVLGSQYTLSSREEEETLYGFEEELVGRLGGDIWNKKWQSIFQSNHEKTTLLKGLVLLEKIYETNNREEYFRWSVATTILVFREIEKEWNNGVILNPELLNWILDNKSSNPYTPFGEQKFQHLKSYSEYLKFIEAEESRAGLARLQEKEEQQKKLNRVAEKKAAHRLNREKTAAENAKKYLAAKQYFKKHREKYIHNVIDQKLPFPLNLTPKIEIYRLRFGGIIRKLSEHELNLLIDRVPKNSATHIKKFRKTLIKRRNSNHKNLKKRQ